jgi:hypothetical protein
LFPNEAQQGPFPPFLTSTSILLLYTFFAVILHTMFVLCSCGHWLHS